MSKEICKLSLTAVDDGENINVEGDLDFDGSGQDLVTVFAHLFELFELEDYEAFFIFQAAIELRAATREEDTHGTE